MSTLSNTNDVPEQWVWLIWGLNEHLANLTNLFFSIALLHGGAHIVSKHAHRVHSKFKEWKNRNKDKTGE